MRFSSLCSNGVALFALRALALPTATANTTCTPLANGFAAIDDSPAINAALASCGASGTIVLPADQASSLFTPLDFSPRRDCNVQIEGTLILAASQLPYYADRSRAVFTIANATGVRIRSVAGTGVIDGNADRVFRLQGDSSGLRFEGLKISAGGINAAYAAFDNVAFEMGAVRNVTMANVDIDFRALPENDSPVGTCFSFDHGTDAVAVRNVSCRRAFMGAHVMFDTMGNSAPTAANATATVQNVVVSNFTFAGTHATGVKSWFNLSKKVVRNAVWEWVTVEEGTPAAFDACYASQRSTQYYPDCVRWATYDAEVVFRHYRGKVGNPPTDAKWGEVNGLMDVRPVFEDWVADK
ncbi:glycoside hydrolase family 28 protein [Karstenula rhodostoma CBS 690.94]|uniref:Glycoside hydrolase family 28 protein n=1 Tax=Karstenula rhodostoma CBS 690.94 TaxID=1392251 RepID=A0A9P4P8X2_9PLEO|nr:glycoside hydrolase family 28 protein [Karstenula rhodostoma CBS 690.94]